MRIQGIGDVLVNGVMGDVLPTTTADLDRCRKIQCGVIPQDQVSLAELSNCSQVTGEELTHEQTRAAPNITNLKLWLQRLSQPKL